MSGDAQLAAMIERIRAFGSTATEATAREAAPLVQEAAQASAAAGTDPYGNAWAPRKDGSRAMPNAAANVLAYPVGEIVRLVARGGIAIQNRLKKPRRTLPKEGELSARIVLALEEGARRAFTKAFT